MKSLAVDALSKVSLPPIPSSLEEVFLFFWHPEDKAFWLLVLVDDTDRAGVWRVAEDGTGTRIVAPDKLALPEDLEYGFLYLRPALFYFDTARKQAVWALSTYEELVLAVFNGKSFARVKQKKTIRSAGDDSFVFDPVRGVLVHFVSQEAIDRGGLSVRELGQDGVWQDKGPVVAEAGSSSTFAAWDERQKLAVVVDRSLEKTFGWDGTKWTELPDSPFSGPKVFATHPRSKGLVLFDATSGYSASYMKYRSAELTDKKWEEDAESDLKPLEGIGPIAYVPEQSASFVYAPKIAGALPHTLGSFDGKKVVPAGRTVITVSGGSTSGPVRLWGSRVYSLAGKELAETAAGPEISTIGILADRSGCIAVGMKGELERLTPKGWTSICKAPRGFTERSESSMGVDGSGRILLVGGGDRFGTKKFLTDTWLFDGKKWTQVSTKGPAPKSLCARVAFVPARSSWVVIGGCKKNASTDDLEETHELDANHKWVAFRSKFSESPGMGARFFARDDASGQLFLVTYGCNEPDKLFVYRGAGAWHAVGAIDVELVPWGLRSGIDAPYAYDDERRVLVGHGKGSLIDVAIGDALDAVRPNEVTKPAVSEAARKSKSNVKKEGKRAPSRTAPRRRAPTKRRSARS